MADFRFIPVNPHPLLKPYIAKMSVFESSGRLPAPERKLIVPNANFKLTLTYRNGIVAGIGDRTFTQRENELSLTGLIDTPVILDPTDDVQTGTVIIEFNPLGAYRFFRLQYAEVKNQIIGLNEMFGSETKDLQYQLAEAKSVALKLQLLQDFLLKRLETIAGNPIYDYCIDRILASNGHLSVAQLEKETGYSSRWLHTKFSENLGTGPKNLAEIIRFKQFYHVFSTGAKVHDLKEHIYHHYHDQSHFIRAFKRFTGTTPTDLQNSMNELSTKNFTS
jgi:AraC-like DNA-binding protein